MTLFQLPPDKAQHVFYGVALSLVATLLFIGLSLHGFPTAMVAVPYVGVMLATLAGAVKEGLDYFKKMGTPDFLDFVATALGGAAVSLPLLVITHL
jgi:hypothetical protein